MERNEAKIGAAVVVSDLPSAMVYTIAGVEGTVAALTWPGADGWTNRGRMDVGVLRRPSKEQLSIAYANRRGS